MHVRRTAGVTGQDAETAVEAVVIDIEIPYSGCQLHLIDLLEILTRDEFVVHLRRQCVVGDLFQHLGEFRVARDAVHRLQREHILYDRA